MVVDGRPLSTYALDGKGPDDFVVHVVELPSAAAAAARGQGLRVHFVAHAGRRTPRLFEVRLLAREDAPLPPHAD